MSIYIGNNLEDRLEALETENVSLRKYNLEDRLKALETENALLKKYNEYHQVAHEIDHMSDMHLDSSFYKKSMKLDNYVKIEEWFDSSIGQMTVIQKLDKKDLSYRIKTKPKIEEGTLTSTTTGHSTYTPCQMSSEDIVNTHDTFMKSFGIELSDDDKRLPYLYWTPKLHKSPVKHRFIAGSSKCTTKQLSSLLTKILTVIKTGLEKYCSIKTSHTGVNNMWILKNSTNLLSSLGHLRVHKATSIQTFDFSTLYTSIPHDLLKSRMNNIINNAFKHKNGATRYTHIKVGRNKSYFTSDPLNGDNKYSANDICKMIEFLWIAYTLDLVDNFSNKWLAFLWEQTVPHYWLTCFSIPTKMSFWINS